MLRWSGVWLGLTLAAAAVDPERLGRLDALLVVRGPSAALLGLAALVALATGAVTVSGAVVGWLLVGALMVLSGWPAVLVFSTFFVVGTGATRLGYRHKRELGIAQERGGRRGATHALANTGAAVVIAFLGACGRGPAAWWTLAMVAALATAAFDTAASEIGQFLGRTHVLPTTLRRVPAGTEGAVSLEGTLGGALGAAAVAAAAVSTGLLPWGAAACALGGATVGAMAESFAGALAPPRRTSDHDLLNFDATLVGAGTAVLLQMLLR